MTDIFNWQIDGHLIMFLRKDAVWRPVDTDLRARAWLVEDGWRASISNGRVVKISSRHTVPQEALRECAQYFLRLVA